MRFLGDSTMRVCVFLFTLATCFHVVFTSISKMNIEWANIGIFVGVFFAGKVIQKGIEGARKPRV